MGPSIVAAVAALAGVGITTLVQEWRQRAGRRDRDRQLVATLASKIRGHRSQQYLKVADRRDGVADTREAREARYQARADMYDALDAVVLLVRDRQVVAAAHAAVDAAVAIGDLSPDGRDYETELQRLGDTARRAHTTLRQTAATNL